MILLYRNVHNYIIISWYRYSAKEYYYRQYNEVVTVYYIFLWAVTVVYVLYIMIIVRRVRLRVHQTFIINNIIMQYYYCCINV